MPQINWAAAAVIVAIAIALIQGIRFTIGKVFKLGKISARLATLEADVKEIKTSVSKNSDDLKKDVNNILKMLAERGLAHSNSPRVLSEDGKKVLESSGINSIVDDKFDLIVERVRERNPENPYQAEIAILDVVAALIEDPALKDAIEEGAFNSGYFVPSVLFVGGLYIRDKVLEELGMKAEDIDHHMPKKGK